MKALNLDRNTVIASHIVVADTPWTRMKGLLGRSSLSEQTGLLITQCNSIHMFFMKFPIDVLFLDHNNQAVGVVKDIRPYQLSPIFWKAVKALELPSGTLEKAQVEPGHRISLQ